MQVCYLVQSIECSFSLFHRRLRTGQIFVATLLLFRHYLFNFRHFFFFFGNWNFEWINNISALLFIYFFYILPIAFSASAFVFSARTSANILSAISFLFFNSISWAVKITFSLSTYFMRNIIQRICVRNVLRTFVIRNRPFSIAYLHNIMYKDKCSFNTHIIFFDKLTIIWLNLAKSTYLIRARFKFHQSIDETRNHRFQVVFFFWQQLRIQRDLFEKWFRRRIIVSSFVLQIYRRHIVHARVDKGHEERHGSPVFGR